MYSKEMENMFWVCLQYKIFSCVLKSRFSPGFAGVFVFVRVELLRSLDLLGPFVACKRAIVRNQKKGSNF